MQLSVLVTLTLLVLTAFGFLVGRRRAVSAAGGAPASLHSLPNYYGYYIALWTGAPALLLVCVFGAGRGPCKRRHHVGAGARGGAAGARL
ncbi:phosphate ABC transporter permease family protein [Maricaulaceae bacterium MS644]